MKSMKTVSVVLLLLAGTALAGCGGSRESDSDRFDDPLMQELRKKQAVSEWWKQGLPQREPTKTIQELPLYPAFRWSFSSQEKEIPPTHGIEHIINEYIAQRTAYDFDSLKIRAAQEPAAELPARYSFMIPKAKEKYRMSGETAPTVWTTEATLAGFVDEQEAFSDFQYHYFRDFYHPKNTAEIFGISTAAAEGMRITIEPDVAAITNLTGSRPTAEDQKEAADRAIAILTNVLDSLQLESILITKSDDTTVILRTTSDDPDSATSFSFCLIDEENTQRIQDYVDVEGERIFDTDGNLGVPDIPASEMSKWLVRGYYRLDTEAERFWTTYLVIGEVTGLGTFHIEKIESGKDFMDKVQLILHFSAEGGELFYRITAENVGRRLAIMMNDHVLMQARIAEPIRDSVRVTGVSEAEAKNIIEQFRNRAE